MDAICTHCVFFDNCLSIAKRECGLDSDTEMSFTSIRYIKQYLIRGCKQYTPTTQKLVLDKLERIESLLISQQKSDEL